METIDYIIAIPIAWGIIRGFWKGLISEIAQFTALVLGFILGSKFSHIVSIWIINFFNISENIVSLVSFIIIFIAVIILVFIIAKILTKTIKAISLGWLNSIGGLVFGGLKFLLIIGIILQTLISFDKSASIISTDTKEKSLFLEPSLLFVDFFSPYIKKALFDEDTKVLIID